ncbi:MAG: hypothetical protein SNG02_01520 [Rikenellaceae bacterium]
MVGRLKRQITRLRHRRGHGVHSPYIYNIVREVFMRRAPISAPTPLYEALISLGVRSRRARELENLRHHCGLSTFGVNTMEPLDMVICSVDASTERIMQITKSGEQSGTTVVILQPHLNGSRGEMCDAIVANHQSTSVNRLGYLIIFNNHLPKQHFTL